MCGLIYKHNLNGDPVNNDIMQQFDKQRSRGVEGFGIYDGSTNHIIKASKEDAILKWLVKYDSNMLLFHHRYPTSTKNTKRTAHPFSTKQFFGDTQYVLVHNGAISNHKDLHKEHTENFGIQYQSETKENRYNDSETLLWDVALTLEGHQDKPKAVGGVAFICLKLLDGKVVDMYYYRNISRPLKVHFAKDVMELSSEGQGVDVPIQSLYKFNYATREVTQVDMDFKIYSYTPTQSAAQNYNWNDSYWDDEYDWGGRQQSWNYKWGEKGSKGDWVGQHIKEKWGKIVSRYQDNACNQYDLNEYEEEEELVAAALPDTSEVNARCFEYLLSSHGNFENAYWLAENDYMDLMEDRSSELEFYETMLLEDVMEKLMNDPEYVNEKSISSMWEYKYGDASWT